MSVTIATNYVAGVGVAMCSSLCSAIGLMLQKKQHLLSAKRRVLVEPPDADGKPRTKTAYWRQPLWLMGIGLMLVGAIMSFAVFALLGQAVGTHTTYQYLLLEGGTDSHFALL